MGRSLKMVSGALGRKAEETRRTIDELMRRHGAKPKQVAAAILGAVESGAGVVTVGPEAFAVDLLRRASRPVYDAVMERALGVLLGGR